MNSSNRFFTTSSPTLVLPMNQQHVFNRPSSPSATHYADRSKLRRPSPSLYAPWPVSNPPRSSPAVCDSAAKPRGSKRSRDESDLDHEIVCDERIATPDFSEPEPMYGEGMTIIRPDGFSVSAASQTGTWIDEAVGRPTTLPSVSTPSSGLSTDQPPQLHSRKSQRLDLSNGSASTINNTDAPVDSYSLLLGIGWASLPDLDAPASEPCLSSPCSCPEDPALAALRGWTRFIANHYPMLTSIKMLLRRSSDSSYLVQASQGHYLFPEDLSSARLVGKRSEVVLRNLRSVPVAFEDGDELSFLRVGHPPQPMSAPSIVDSAESAPLPMTTPAAETKISSQLDNPISLSLMFPGPGLLPLTAPSTEAMIQEEMEEQQMSMDLD
ncbi:MAG: hypothetical protein M1817_001970 [Caeruleum heppii]|nr:MAG: hypothetical protein M1817_001970 [Caeruleum heppii]